MRLLLLLAPAVAWRPLLRSRPHAVVVDSSIKADEAGAAWTEKVQLAGEAALCEFSVPKTSKQSSEDLAARWAPLRFRCHAWQALENSSVPWSYRICFGSDVVAWAPSPFLQRLDLGWYNTSLDEDNGNGSLTLHYVNGATKSETTLRCSCGQGPKLTNWSSQGLNHSLQLQLPSCCSLRSESNATMSVPETFHWLLEPLTRLENPCLQLAKRNSWDYFLCFQSNASEASLSRSPSISEGQAVPRRVLLGGPTEAQVRLVPAEPVVAGQMVETGWGSDANAPWAAVPAQLAEALSLGHDHLPRKALELSLATGEDCRAANGTRKHSARLRFICPATWRLFAPDAEGGHSALLAVERPSSCDWVAWVSSSLLCAFRPLRPKAPRPERSRRELRCKRAPGAAPKPPEEAVQRQVLGEDGAGSCSASADCGPKVSAAPPEPRLDRSGVLFHVGQRVSADGTGGVVLGWDPAPRPELLALRLDDATPVPGAHFLVAALRGQLPGKGALRSGATDVPGHVAYLAQEDLFELQAPGEVPLAVARRFFDGGRPAPWLAAFYPKDVPAGRAQDRSFAASAQSEPFARLQELAARLSAVAGSSAATEAWGNLEGPETYEAYEEVPLDDQYAEDEVDLDDQEYAEEWEFAN